MYDSAAIRQDVRKSRPTPPILHMQIQRRNTSKSLQNIGNIGKETRPSLRTVNTLPVIEVTETMPDHVTFWNEGRIDQPPTNFEGPPRSKRKSPDSEPAQMQMARNEAMQGKPMLLNRGTPGTKPGDLTNRWQVMINLLREQSKWSPNNIKVTENVVPAEQITSQLHRGVENSFKKWRSTVLKRREVNKPDDYDISEDSSDKSGSDRVVDPSTLRRNSSKQWLANSSSALGTETQKIQEKDSEIFGNPTRVKLIRQSFLLWKENSVSTSRHNNGRQRGVSSSAAEDVTSQARTQAVTEPRVRSNTLPSQRRESLTMRRTIEPLKLQSFENPRHAAQRGVPFVPSIMQKYKKTSVTERIFGNWEDSMKTELVAGEKKLRSKSESFSGKLPSISKQDGQSAPPIESGEKSPPPRMQRKISQAVVIPTNEPTAETQRKKSPRHGPSTPPLNTAYNLSPRLLKSRPTSSRPRPIPKSPVAETVRIVAAKLNDNIHLPDTEVLDSIGIEDVLKSWNIRSEVTFGRRKKTKDYNYLKALLSDAPMFKAKERSSQLKPDDAFNGDEGVFENAKDELP